MVDLLIIACDNGGITIFGFVADSCGDFETGLELYIIILLLSSSTQGLYHECIFYQ